MTGARIRSFICTHGSWIRRRIPYRGLPTAVAGIDLNKLDEAIAKLKKEIEEKLTPQGAPAITLPDVKGKDPKNPPPQQPVNGGGYDDDGEGGYYRGHDPS